MSETVWPGLIVPALRRLFTPGAGGDPVYGIALRVAPIARGVKGSDGAFCCALRQILPEVGGFLYVEKFRNADERTDEVLL